jgi:HKD family nuclease
MAWERLLAKDQLEIIVDTDKGTLMMETSSGGAVPKYVTVHIQNEQELDELIAALQKAKDFMVLLNK